MDVMLVCYQYYCRILSLYLGVILPSGGNPIVGIIHSDSPITSLGLRQFILHSGQHHYWAALLVHDMLTY